MTSRNNTTGVLTGLGTKEIGSYESDVGEGLLFAQVLEGGDHVGLEVVPPEAEQLLRVVRVVAHLGDRFKNRIIVLLTHFQNFSSFNKCLGGQE